ncbi:MAG: glycerol kinase GlpK [Bacteroidales bacterium]|nr:glycerol kinase GlpK [Bacteroidales bacterium]
MILAIDQSTSGTKVMLFNEKLEMLKRINKAHQQYYPQPGWVEHDADEIYRNVVKGIQELLTDYPEVVETLRKDPTSLSLSITNQRETVVVWNKTTGKPIAHAVVWQCLRGTEYCNALKAAGKGPLVQEKSGLIIDPYFSASGAEWLLDHVEGARESAQRGELLMGTMECWLIWKLTGGRRHVTDVTNASRTLLMNIHTLQWDKELMELFTIPVSMLPEILPCDSVFGETDIEGLLPHPIQIAGVLGDSHGALAGQMCFDTGLGKATYGTGSSVMVNIGEQYSSAPQGLVTSVAFAAAGKCFYAFEGNIHCTGATLKWLQEQMQLISSPAEVEPAALSVPDNGGVYFVPAFAGLGAPWWDAEARAAIVGMSLATTRAHILRAALESIGYQVNDLIQAMTQQAGIALKEIRVDGGPTRNATLMQFQADLLGVPVNCSDVEEASALGAVVMNVLARGVYANMEEVAKLRRSRWTRQPQADQTHIQQWVEGWHHAIHQVKN